MRPIRLEMEGFASFRERCEIDFDGVDLFVLTGPTGSGKSSVLDAMIFALYGLVPRYGSEKMYWPVITQGKSQALVKLDFAVGDDEFTIVRDVRRTNGGATLREIRLEQGERVLGATAAEVKDAIHGLLGLEFDQFKKCVALPQGAFADFLGAKSADRQTLLVNLLDLWKFRNMAKGARAEAMNLESMIGHVRNQIAEDYSDATSQNFKAVQKRLKALEQLDQAIVNAAENLTKLRTQAVEAGKAADDKIRVAEELAALAPPDGVEALDLQLQTVEETIAVAAKEHEKAAMEREAARATLAKLPPLHELLETMNHWEAKARVEEQAGLATKELEVASRKLEEAESARQQFREERERRTVALEEARRKHSASELAAHLEPGKSCPVCLQIVDEVPRRDPVPDLDSALAALDKAEQGLAMAARSLEQATADHAGAKRNVEEKRERLKELDDSLEEQRPQEQIERLLGDREKANAAVAAAESVFEKRTRELSEAQEKKSSLNEKTKKAWSELDQRLGELKSLEPPKVDGTSLYDSWKRLTLWAHDLAPKIENQAEELTTTANESSKEAEKIIQGLLDQCSAAEVQATTSDYEKAVAGALSVARRDIEILEQKIERRVGLEKEIEDNRMRANIAKETSRLLGLKHFERWLLDRAQRRLADSASTVLRTLSSGQYSITLDDGNEFAIIDHMNADEPRSAKTLSGGETFLASLALALALAEDISQMGAKGAVRLESLFLDEGFGTLDPDTLDVVATAIENLGAQGRMVGIITHVRDLAERIPVRYEVRKDARTSRVEKVIA